MPKVITIVGPTSSGKTSLALSLCQKFNGQVISADSRQIYKHMDIGTGKLPINKSASTQHKIVKDDCKWQIEGIDMWGYDLTTPGSFYSAYEFAEFARNKILDLQKQNTPVFLVGGTGFYVDTVAGKINLDEIPANQKLRKDLEKMSTAQLQTKLQNLDATVYAKIDTKNPMRLMRAIEKATQPKNQPTKMLPTLENTQFIYIGLTAPRETLYARTDAWLEQVWQNGLLDETQNLIKAGFTNTPQLNGLIYKSAKAFLAGTLTAQDAIQRAKYDLHSYIRRQQTWFKKNPDTTWFDICEKTFSQKVEDVVKSILDG
ncbi:MAG: tRNA delta(2)-isopentenylpyrophosphate transferase [uncultured bacterium]|nr:MAG: tRNA delta(2)-isopentenylpyrophosphate transferase [uncultured bacterium]